MSTIDPTAEFAAAFTRFAESTLNRLVSQAVEQLRTEKFTREDHIAALKLLTRLEAATVLNCSEQTLSHWATSGYGPAMVKVGTKVGYRAEDLDAWIASRVTGGSLSSRKAS
jgi:predicted DNA-binding transcriptional regulator AlpA